MACQGWRLLPAERRISTAATCVAGRGELGRGKVGGCAGGRNKFSRQMNSRLALLSAQKATETRAGTVKKQFPVPAVCSLERTKAAAEVTRHPSQIFWATRCYKLTNGSETGF